MSAIEQLSLDHIERAPVYTFDSLASYLAAARRSWKRSQGLLKLLSLVFRQPPGVLVMISMPAPGEEVLGWLGFTHAHTDHQGDHWTRPGKDHDKELAHCLS